MKTYLIALSLGLAVIAVTVVVTHRNAAASQVAAQPDHD